MFVVDVIFSVLSIGKKEHLVTKFFIEMDIICVCNFTSAQTIPVLCSPSGRQNTFTKTNVSHECVYLKKITPNEVYDS